ncbi:elongation factor G [Chelatococcus sp. XZ-Ab1]|uniref:elongation factor G n=1 Tax=Chelatococcus sp. XZ-Ab1 TaxID=3034027 RepID=UPI0023E3B7B9|nr:elongation factor G [Chelatococcus sp. XZ-Ab1]
MDASGRERAGPRCIAIVGPYQSGKTSLMEACLARMGAIDRQGKVADRNTIGDASPEARAQGMSIEPNVASGDFLGERFTFVDCPGSIEFLHDMRTVLPACDAAVVVCEADDRKVPALELVMRELEEADVPRFLFLNKIDAASRRVRETLASLQRASRTPLLLRQIPIWKDGIAIGFIDLALERAFVYREYAASEVIDLPVTEVGREKEARFSMLERLADYDDELMEDLVEEIEPPRDRVFDDLSRELRDMHVVPVLFGSAERGNGVTRLLKALRHEAPRLAATRARLGVPEEGPPLAFAMKTSHNGQGGKLTLARVLRGPISEGDTVVSSRGGEARVAGIVDLKGQGQSRRTTAEEGETVAFARVDNVATSDAFAVGKERPTAIVSVAPPDPVFSLALLVRDRKDDVRLTTALGKIVEEDPSLVLEQRPDLGEMRLCGQGEMHLRVAIARLASRFGVTVDVRKPQIAYRETIRHAAQARGRHKKQSGGHGQFGDVVLHVEPLPRGEGIVFTDTITGGVVPKQYIPSVEIGVREAAEKGPLGFPVVDMKVTLTDGSYHTVDSSDMAFRAAARLAMAEMLPNAKPVLLEPMLAVEIAVPTEAMSKATAIISARRGQILGYDGRPGWLGWDLVNAMIPEAEMDDLIVELRSATAGVGSFSARFDHLAELSGKAADQVVMARAAATGG